MKRAVLTVIFLGFFSYAGAVEICPGEKVIYAVSPVGTAEYNDLGIVEYKGKKLWMVTFLTKVPGFKDLEKIYADPKSGLPVTVERFIDWPLSQEYIIEEYDPEHNSQVNRRYVKNKLTNEYKFHSEKGPYYNAILLPFYLRGMKDLHLEWKMVVRVPEEFTVTLSEIEDVKVKDKMVKAYHFTGEPTKFDIWISRDSARVPVIIKGSSYSMIMQSHTPGKDEDGRLRDFMRHFKSKAEE